MRRGEITNFGRNLNPEMITNQDLTGFENLVGLSNSLRLHHFAE